MNKNQLIRVVAEKAQLTQKDAATTIQAVFSTITNALANGKKVQIFGFGTFEVRERSARIGRNPHTGGQIQLPATKVPALKAGKELKRAVK